MVIGHGHDKGIDRILLGALGHVFFFPINLGNFIIPIHELIFFRGRRVEPPAMDIVIFP